MLSVFCLQWIQENSEAGHTHENFQSILNTFHYWNWMLLPETKWFSTHGFDQPTKISVQYSLVGDWIKKFSNNLIFFFCRLGAVSIPLWLIENPNLCLIPLRFPQNIWSNCTCMASLAKVFDCGASLGFAGCHTVLCVWPVHSKTKY